MRKWIETTGRSEEDAIAAALFQLGLERDDVSVEVMERAKSGFLGFGSNPAKVRVSYEEENGVPRPIRDPLEEDLFAAVKEAPKAAPAPMAEPAPAAAREAVEEAPGRRRPFWPPSRAGSPPSPDTRPDPPAGSGRSGPAPPKMSCRRGTRSSSALRSPAPPPPPFWTRPARTTRRPGRLSPSSPACWSGWRWRPCPRCWAAPSRGTR